MVQRSIEIAAGLCGSIAGLALLANLYSLSFSSDGWSPFGHPLYMTGMFALWAYAAALELIAVGVILPGVPAM
jgi:hypothetical protein